jgi:hypothetical protein
LKNSEKKKKKRKSGGAVRLCKKCEESTKNISKVKQKNLNKHNGNFFMNLFFFRVKKHPKA